MVEDLLAAREIIVSHEAVRCWAETFGRIDASKICRHAPQFGDKWHLDEVVISSTARSIGCGVPSMLTASLSTPWFRVAGLGARRRSSCACNPARCA
jgi:hypothetical protein